MRTLNNLSDLRESKFGQPPPRHGLILLWWFVHECVRIDSNGRMVAPYNPNNGDFGFRLFYNREYLLPYSKLPYYEVGNLNKTGSLPKYVTVYYTGNSDDSNKDRIIVSFNSKGYKFDSIYVTQHSDQVNFDQNHTYCISFELMKEIKGLSREEFLKGPARTNQPNPSQDVSIDMPSTYNPSVPARVSYTPQPYTPQPHTPQPHTPQPHTPQPHTPQPHTPQPHTPQPHTPQPHTPQPHTPQPHTPQPHTPQPVQSETRLRKKCCCVVFCIFIFLLLRIIVAVVL